MRRGTGIPDLILPDTCLHCGAARRGLLPLCAGCRRGLGTPSDWDLADALALEPGIDRCHALWYVDRGGVARSVIHALKYRSMPALGVVIGRALGYRIRADRREPGRPFPDVVIPVPLHPVRERERGYNQAEAIARPLSDAIGAPMHGSALVRIRAGRTQTRKGAADRRRALAGAFRLRAPDAVRQARVLLVDDVLTTGSTAAEAAAVLRDGGALSVELAVAGYTRPTGRRPTGPARLSASAENP